MDYQQIFAKIGSAEDLDGYGHWPSGRYTFEAEVVHALVAAHSSGMPLLVRGEVGTGKSTLALAAAKLFDTELLVSVIHPNSEAEELFWQYDYTQRLACANRPDGEPLGHERFLRPGPFWYALDPKSAQKQAGTYHHNQPFQAPINCARAAQNGVTYLIDEIDKADTTMLANGLLEVLANGRFHCPFTDAPIVQQTPPPLVIFTTNDMRELSPAFMRRCVVLELELDHDVREYLRKIGRAHYPESVIPDEVLSELAGLVHTDRQAQSGAYRSGPAEYLALLKAWQELGASRDQLPELARYFLKGA